MRQENLEFEVSFGLNNLDAVLNKKGSYAEKEIHSVRVCISTTKVK